MPPVTTGSIRCWPRSNFVWRSRSPRWARPGSAFGALSPRFFRITACHYSVLVGHPADPYKLAPRAGRLVRVGGGRGMKNKKGINGVKAVNGVKGVNGTHGNGGLNGHNGQNGHSNGHNGHN